MPWYESYCFDEAVSFCGAMIENLLDGVEGKDAKSTQAKRERLLTKLLGTGAAEKSTQFADPAEIFSKG